MLWCVFFFKQKTAYEVRISDWSSDVCSSDLVEVRAAGHAGGVADGLAQGVVLALGEGELLDQAGVGVLEGFSCGGDAAESAAAVSVEGALEFGEAGIEGFEVLLLLVFHLHEEFVGLTEDLHDAVDGLVAEYPGHEKR